MNEQTDFLEEVGKLTAYTEQYVKDQIAYQKLEVAERSSKVIALGIVFSIIGVFAFIILILLSIVLGLYIGERMNSYVDGFLIVVIIYVMFCSLLFLLRKPLFIAPITLKIVKKVYEQE